MNVNTPIWDWLDYAVVYGLRFLFVLMFILFNSTPGGGQGGYPE